MVDTEPVCAGTKEPNKKYFIGLWLTDGCNLKCKYCFQERYKPHVHMDDRTLEQTIKFINKMKPQGLAFFGGEPLLRKKQMKRVLAQTDIQKYYLTTNGTLFDDDLFDWLEFHNVHLNLSLDGTKKTQDYWRSKSYDRVIQHLPRILEHMKKVGGQVLCSCVMESQLYENVKHIKELGFQAVYINQLDGYSSKVRNELEKLDIFRTQYRKVLTLRDSTFEVSDYGRWKQVLGGDFRPGDCGYTKLGLGISPTGLLSACHRGPEMPPDFSFGDVVKGIDKKKEAHIRGMVTLPKMCSECGLHLSQCPVSCYLEHEKFGVNPHDVHCAYEKAKAEIILGHAAIANLEKAVIKKPDLSQTRLIIGTLIDPHKYYILPTFLKSLVKMEFPSNTDFYFILDHEDHKTYKLLSSWMEGLFPFAPFKAGLVRSFRSVKIPTYTEDTWMDRIVRGRDLLLNLALKGTYSHLMWLDSDIVAPGDTVSKLLSVGSGIAGGLVTTRDEGRRKTWYNTYIDKRDEGGGFPSKTDFKKGDIIEVDATGCDCVIIRRNVLEAVGKYEYSRNPPEGEDMKFCLKARDLGLGKVKIHTGVETRHIGIDDVLLKEIKGKAVNY